MKTFGSIIFSLLIALFSAAQQCPEKFKPFGKKIKL